jgi:hypothetical protein
MRILLGPRIWPRAAEVGILAGGLMATFGFLLLSQGYRLAEASRAALPWASLGGLLLFNTPPSLSPSLGGGADPRPESTRFVTGTPSNPAPHRDGLDGSPDS